MRVSMARIERVNLALIELLERDGRMTVTDLARYAREAQRGVRERLSVLEASGSSKATAPLSTMNAAACASVRLCGPIARRGTSLA